MSTRYAFFDSQSGDRIYTADDMSRVIRRYARDGYVPNDQQGLEVVADSPASMNVVVSLGTAYVQGRFFQVYSTTETLSIDAADPSDDRIDRVVVRLDFNNRLVELDVLKGTPAASPNPPPLTRDSDSYELSLAQVLVQAGTTEIQSGDITDERNDSSVCGASRPWTGVAYRDTSELSAERVLQEMYRDGDAKHRWVYSASEDTLRLQYWDGSAWQDLMTFATDGQVTGGGAWTRIATLEDTDAGTNLDLDTGVLGTTYDVYKIVGTFANHSGGAADLRLQVNGIATNDYNTVSVASGGISTQTGESSFRLCRPFPYGGQVMEFTLRGHEPNPSAGGNDPAIIGNASVGSTPQGSLVRGNLDQDVQTINRLRIFSASGDEFTARVAVFGMNI